MERTKSPATIIGWSFLLLVGFHLTTNFHSQSDTFLEKWRSFSGDQYMYHHSRTITDIYQNTYVVGSTVDVDGDYDILVVKYDKHGVVL